MAKDLITITAKIEVTHALIEDFLKYLDGMKTGSGKNPDNEDRIYYLEVIEEANQLDPAEWTSNTLDEMTRFLMFEKCGFTSGDGWYSDYDPDYRQSK